MRVCWSSEVEPASTFYQSGASRWLSRILCSSSVQRDKVIALHQQVLAVRIASRQAPVASKRVVGHLSVMVEDRFLTNPIKRWHVPCYLFLLLLTNSSRSPGAIRQRFIFAARICFSPISSRTRSSVRSRRLAASRTVRSLLRSTIRPSYLGFAIRSQVHAPRRCSMRFHVVPYSTSEQR